MPVHSKKGIPCTVAQLHHAFLGMSAGKPEQPNGVLHPSLSYDEERSGLRKRTNGVCLVYGESRAARALSAQEIIIIAAVTDSLCCCGNVRE